MSYQQIETEKHDRIAIIRLNRPRYRNAQSRILLEEMNDAFAEADNDTSVRVVVLCGASEHFSAGHDLGTPEEIADQEAEPFGPGTLGRINRSWHLVIDSSLRWRDVKNPPSPRCRGTAFSVAT